MSLRRTDIWPLLAVATLALACSSSGSADAGAYQGVAYPNHLQSFDRTQGRLGYVANRYSDTVSVVDLDAMTLLGTVPVGRDPVDIDGPRHIVLDPAGELAYLTLSYPLSEKSPHALAQGEQQRAGYVEALNLADLSVVGDARLDSNANELAFSEASGVVAVTHYDLTRALQSSDPDARKANLALIDPASSIVGGAATPKRLLLCAVEAAAAFNADGSRLFVACTGEDSIAVVDPSTEEILSSVPAGSAIVNKPYGVVFDAARERLLVSNQVAGTVTVFDTADTPNLLSTTASLGESMPFFPTFLSDTTIGVPFHTQTGTPQGVAVFDAASGEQLLEVEYSNDECPNPSELSLTGDRRVRLVCEGDHYTPGKVAELDPETLAISSSVDVGIYPERMAISEP